MSVRRLSKTFISGAGAAAEKSSSFLANYSPAIDEMDLIERVTVGSGGSANITFSNIPQIYQHLQIRVLCKDLGNFGSYYNLRARFNNDSGSNYARHALDGSGSSASAFGFASIDSTGVGHVINNSSTQTSCFSTNIIDILDYASTSKTKTVRSLMGSDWNAGGGVRIGSSLWNSTAAVTSITMFSDSGSNFAQYTTASLYGVIG